MDRQRYMAELSKLLTFMFKEDRAEILQHYNELLDNAEDEQALLEEFGSPTKLAVTISRTYSREERKLSVNVDSKSEDGPAEYKRPDLSEFKPITPVPHLPDDEDEAEDSADYSGKYAQIIEEIRREDAEERGEDYVPMFFGAKAEKEASPKKIHVELAEAEEDAPAEDAAPVEEAEAEAAPVEEAAEGEKPEEAEPVEEADTEASPEAEEETAQVEAEDTPAENGAAVECEEDKTVVEELTEPKVEDPIEAEKTVSEADSSAKLPDYDTELLNESEKAEVAKTLSPGLLILYLIFAIPVGLVLLIALAAVTVAVLGCAAAAIAGGVMIVRVALSGVAVTADLMLIIGAALVAFGVGILLLWIGVWLIVAGFKALIGGIVNLGRKICVKEAEW